MKLPKIYRGYIILILAWLSFFFSTGVVVYGQAVINTQMVLERGLDQSLVGFCSSIENLGCALNSTVAGVLITKFGSRRVMLAGGVLMMLTAGAFLIFRAGVEIWLYMVFFFILGGCVSVCGSVGGPSLINNWFKRRKAMPFALLLTAGSFGGFVWPLIIESITTSGGWVSGWYMILLGGAVSFISMLFIKNKPRDAGEVLDGKTWVATHPEPPESIAAEPPRDKSFLKNPRFYLLCITFSIKNMMYIGVLSYLMLYAIQCGATTFEASVALSTLSIAGFAGRLLSGFQEKLHIPAYLINAFTVLGMGFALILLSFAQTLGYGPGFIAAPALVGFFHGLSFSTQPIMLAECFGRKNFSLVYSTAFEITQLSNALGPMVVLLLSHLFGGGFSTPFLILSVVLLAFFLLALSLKPDAIRRTSREPARIGAPRR